MGAPDRNAVSAASDAIDRLLGADPYAHSESRSRGRRVIIVPPLTAQFKVLESTRHVRVISIHRRLDRPPRP